MYLKLNLIYTFRISKLECYIEMFENLTEDIENEMKLLSFTKITIESELNTIDQNFHHINNCSILKNDLDVHFMSSDAVFNETKTVSTI